jgi:hypothetical protein
VAVTTRRTHDGDDFLDGRRVRRVAHSGRSPAQRRPGHRAVRRMQSRPGPLTGLFALLALVQSDRARSLAEPGGASSLLSTHADRAQGDARTLLAESPEIADRPWVRLG